MLELASLESLAPLGGAAEEVPMMEEVFREAPGRMVTGRSSAATVRG